MFLYFKRREKRGKREAPRPRFLVLRRKTLTVGAALLAAAAIFGAVNAPAAVRASVATRQLPIYCVERDQKVCSISFDAAWGADNTQKILDVLADYGVKATFFVVGNWADQYPEQAKAIVDSGCELMNHSNAHDHYNSLTAEQIIKDVNTCNDTSTPTPAPTIMTNTILTSTPLNTIPMCCCPSSVRSMRASGRWTRCGERSKCSLTASIF